MPIRINTSKIRGTSKKISLLVSAVFVLLMAGAIYFFSQDNLLVGISILILPFPVLYLYSVMANPRVGFISALFANYYATGLSRYIPAPVGLVVDILLVLTFISVIFSQFNRKLDWKNADKDYSYFVLIWFGMTLAQLLNPETVSRVAWFYAMRGYALYLVLTVPLVFLIFNRPKDFEIFIKLCAWFTITAILKGIIQKYLGVDRWEQQWLNEPGNFKTHILFGVLRVFSFFSDAGTYGGSMGYFGVLFIVLGIHEKSGRNKLFYYLIAVGSLYCMLISGTRSAIAVPLVGFLVYTILTRKFKIIFLVGCLMFVIFFFFKFTTIGQGNYDIRRMRSAFESDNASLNVRVENRKLFAEYLKTRPFGGGVGSAGNWGMRFTPDTFLAQTATDGWYIQIWAEQGIVGLIFYLVMIAYFAVKSVFIIFFRLKKPENIYRAIAFLSGSFGLIVSSYSASSLGQMPNTIIVFTSLTIISLMPKWEAEEAKATLVEKVI